MPYLARLLEGVLERRIQHHPAILVVGPRGRGQDHVGGEPILIDECQVVPEVLGAVKRAMDGEPRPGGFLITGSVRGEVDDHRGPEEPSARAEAIRRRSAA